MSQERRAAANLEHQGVRHYLPEILVPRRRGGERPEVLFPGYVFIQVDRRVGWGSLSGTRGIARLLLQGDEPVRMPDRDVESLRAAEIDGYVRLAPRFAVGQEVVSETGFYGVVQGTTGIGRVRVLLTILGRAVGHEMMESDLAAA